jgi:hypothetical protein
MQTKIRLLHTLLCLGLGMLTFEANSQTWQLGGNPDLGANGIGTPPSNQLGSLQNTRVDFITNGVTRMPLRGQNDATIGWLGLGILNPVHPLHMHQSDALATSNTGIAITDASILNSGASGSQDGLNLHVNPGNSGADIAWLGPTPLGVLQSTGESMRFTMNGVNESRIGFPVNSGILILNPMSQFPWSHTIIQLIRG